MANDGNDSGRFPWPLAAALALFLALLFLPITGWIVTDQAIHLAAPPRELASLLNDLGVKDEYLNSLATQSPPDVPLRKYAESHPQDFEIRLAYAVRHSGSIALDRLRFLRARFPKQASLYAHILRYACFRQIGPIRREEYLIAGEPVGQTSDHPTDKEARQTLTDFDADASTGAGPDPCNGFFPFMRSIGLFAAHRDSEALASIRLAAKKPRWNDYVGEEPRGVTRLNRDALGRRSVIARAAIQSAVLFPHYARLRGATRIATYLAAEDERVGRKSDGLAIRHSILRLGAMMRAQTGPVIESLVGIALTATSEARPGGAPPARRPDNMDAESWTNARTLSYVDYLRRAGYADEARLVIAEMDAGRTARDIVTAGVAKAPIGGVKFQTTVLWWLVDSLVLTNLLWALLIGVGCLILARLHARKEIVVWLAVVSLILLLGASWRVSQSGSALAMYSAVVSSLTESGNGGLPVGLVKLASFGLPFAIPSILLLVLALRKEWRGDRRARAISGAAGAVALLLAVLYAGLAGFTIRQEAAVNAGLDRMTRDEGAYLAELVGKPWPQEVVVK